MQVVSRNKDTGRDNSRYMALILIIGWLLIISLARDVWQIRTGFGRITEANRRLEAEEAKNQALKSKLGMVLTEEYKEKLIREKLNMQKEGEVLVVMPEKDLYRDGLSKKPEILIPEANWIKWWKLLLE